MIQQQNKKAQWGTILSYPNGQHFLHLANFYGANKEVSSRNREIPDEKLRDYADADVRKFFGVSDVFARLLQAG